MKVRLLLAHWAEVQAGQLYALGIGWTEIGPQPTPFAIAAVIEVTWDETNRQHQLQVAIVDSDGQPLLVPTPTGDQPFQINANFDVGRPPGVTPGRSFVAPVALNVPPLPLQAGQGYVARALVDGQLQDEVAFTVRPAQQRPPAGA